MDGPERFPGPHRSTTGIPAQLASTFAAVAFVLESASGLLYSAADHFAPGLSVAPTTLLASGPTGATLIRLGSLIDLLGYLCILPVVLYLRERHRGARLIDLFAVAGLLGVVVGAVGAVTMAAAGPPLIDAYPTASSADRHTLELVFASLYRTVVLGLWQTLESAVATLWLVGTALSARRTLPRTAFAILVVLGLVTAALTVIRLTNP